jgi:hypothetical protein
LQQSGRYEVIQQIAWRQPGLDETAAKPIRIHGGPEYRTATGAPAALGQDYESPTLYGDIRAPVTLEQLDGTVKVVLSQYLHVYTDLMLRKPVTTQALGEDQRLRSVNALYQFRIQDHRRMRSKELHYIDHPLLGILVWITPVEEKPKTQGPGPAKQETGDAQASEPVDAPNPEQPR